MFEGYVYDAIWRKDKESASIMFVFEILLYKRKYSNLKNLITLRPQSHYLRVEVYQ